MTTKMNMKKVTDPYKAVPFIDSKETLKMYIKPIYIIEDYMDNINDYEKYIISMFHILEACFDIEACRHFPITFKLYRNSKDEYTLPFNTFLNNAIFWIGLVPVQALGVRALNADFIKGREEMIEVNMDIPTYANGIFNIMRDNGIGMKECNMTISLMSYYLRQLNYKFWDVQLANISLHDIFDLYLNYPEMKALMDTDIPSDLQPLEIEELLEELLERLDAEFKRIGAKNPITAMSLVSGYIKMKQIREMFVTIGTRPNVFDQTFPIPISNSYLIGGAVKPSAAFPEADSLFISAYANDRYMGNAGYFEKRISLLCGSLLGSKRVYDCGSTAYIPYQVKTKGHLKKLLGKFYKDPNTGDLREVKSEDYHLIGTTIETRSIATCELHNECCAVCMGANAAELLEYENLGMCLGQDGVMQLGQNVLSTKHLLTTRSGHIKWSADFYKFFTLKGTSVLLNDDILSRFDIADYSRFHIIIDAEDIIKDEFDMESQDPSLRNGHFKIVDKETGEMFDITVVSENTESEVYLTSDFMKLLQITNNEPTFADLIDIDNILSQGGRPKKSRRSNKTNDEEADDGKTEKKSIMEVFVENFSLTQTLKTIINIINREAEKAYRKDIYTFLQSLLDLYIEAGLPPHINPIEVIANRLMVDERYNDAKRKIGEPIAHGMSRPLIHDGIIEPYTIERMDVVLFYNMSPNVRMLFNQINRQLLNTEFFSANEWYPTDNMFAERIPTSIFSDTTDAIGYEKDAEDILLKY